MSSKFRYDDKSLQQHILHACAELKNTDVCTEPHIFSQRMRERMERAFTQERRHRLWQKTKAVLAVLLTLLVALTMFWCVRNMEEINLAVEEFLKADSEAPFGDPPFIRLSDEIKEDYVVVMNYAVSYAGRDNKYSGTLILKHRINNREIEIEYVPTRLTETYDPDEGIRVWGNPASLSGENEKILRWVCVHDGQGVYFTLRSKIAEAELFRVVENISVK